MHCFELCIDSVSNKPIKSAICWVESIGSIDLYGFERLLLSRQKVTDKEARRKCLEIGNGIAQLCGLRALYNPRFTHTSVLFCESDEIHTCIEAGWREVQVSLK
jgi:hypothetical protein